jgi:predicted transcriptional regulator
MPIKHPQEIEVWYVLPAVRKELALVLKKKGKSQKEIAQLLGVTEAAVSQYKSKRAKDVELGMEVKVFISKKAGEIKDLESAYRIMQEICVLIKKSGVLCRIHRCVECGLERCAVCGR